MTTTTLRYCLKQTKSVPLAVLNINWKMLCVLGLIATACLLIFYVFQINSLTGGSYLIENYKKEIRQLSEKNKDLEISFAKINFLEDIEQKTLSLNFEKSKGVRYIQVPANFLVQAK